MPKSRIRIIQIRSMQGEIALYEARGQQSAANANLLLFEEIAELGGIPGKDGICLDCGALIPQRTQHVCPKTKTEGGLVPGVE